MVGFSLPIHGQPSYTQCISLLQWFFSPWKLFWFYVFESLRSYYANYISACFSRGKYASILIVLIECSKCLYQCWKLLSWPAYCGCSLPGYWRRKSDLWTICVDDWFTQEFTRNLCLPCLYFLFQTGWTGSRQCLRDIFGSDIRGTGCNLDQSNQSTGQMHYRSYRPLTLGARGYYFFCLEERARLSPSVFVFRDTYFFWSR